MLRKVGECARPLTEADINDLERYLGRRLPIAYKQFLLRYNGGRPTPEYFPIHGMPQNDFGAIHLFFGIDRKIESSNIRWNADVMTDRLPSEYLPIACDNSGDLLCLALDGPSAGEVVFWDYYNEQSSPNPGYENIYKVARSFEGFLESLCCDPDL